MKYNEGSFLSKLKDEQYKSKFMLIVFAVIILFMIFFIRINASSYNKRKEENLNKEENTNNSSYVDELSNYASDPLLYKFIYLSLSNYEFNYNVTFGDDVITSSGKVCNDKILFNFIYNGEEKMFFGNNGASLISSDGTETTRYPYFFVNYYDVQDIVELINHFKYDESDNKYHIANKDLYRLGDSGLTDFKLENPEEDNTIELREVNGKVVGMVMDFSNLFNNEETNIKTVIIDLNYSNFGFVEDFDAPF